jgi:hypothetical protein
MHLERRRLPRTPIYSHHSCGWLTLGPYQARTMRSCDAANDARLRYAERCTVAIRRTMHGCDMPNELPSISIDHPLSRQCRQCSSGTFRPQGGSASKVKPRLGVKRHLCMVLPPWPGAGDAELMRMPRHRSGKARLMVPPWHRPGEVQLMLPPWHRPGEVQLMLPPWHGPGEVKLMLPPWHRPGEVELLLPPWHRPGKAEQVLPQWHRSGAAEMLLLPWPAWQWSVR